MAPRAVQAMLSGRKRRRAKEYRERSRLSRELGMPSPPEHPPPPGLTLAVQRSLGDLPAEAAEGWRRLEQLTAQAFHSTKAAMPIGRVLTAKAKKRAGPITTGNLVQRWETMIGQRKPDLSPSPEPVPSGQRGVLQEGSQPSRPR